jgi:hypothetical protein
MALRRGAWDCCERSCTRASPGLEIAATVVVGDAITVAGTVPVVIVVVAAAVIIVSVAAARRLTALVAAAITAAAAAVGSGPAGLYGSACRCQMDDCAGTRGAGIGCTGLRGDCWRCSVRCTSYVRTAAAATGLSFHESSRSAASLLSNRCVLRD